MDEIVVRKAIVVFSRFHPCIFLLRYEAYNEFAALISDERHQYRFLLRKGDFVLYSNKTMLHGREAFSGPRWVRGAYFDQDKVLKHLTAVNERD